MIDKRFAVKHAKRSVRVADVYYKKHKRTVTSDKLQVTDRLRQHLARHSSLGTCHSQCRYISRANNSDLTIASFYTQRAIAFKSLRRAFKHISTQRDAHLPADRVR